MMDSRFNPASEWRDTGLSAYGRAAALEQEYISPGVAQLADSASHADFAESAGLVQGDAGNVLRKNAGLQRPESVTLGFCDQRFQKRFAHAATTRCGGYID